MKERTATDRIRDMIEKHLIAAIEIHRYSSCGMDACLDAVEVAANHLMEIEDTQEARLYLRTCKAIHDSGTLNGGPDPLDAMTARAALVGFLDMVRQPEKYLEHLTQAEIEARASRAA